MLDDRSQQGIVVLGFPRSGTTLLRRILNAHPRIACPGETYVLTGCARFIAAERVLDGLEVGPLNGLAFAGIEPDETLAHVREFALSLLAKHAAAQGKPRWAEKTAVDSFHLDAIERILGDRVRYVMVYRHPLDVCVSVQQWCSTIERYPDELHHYIQRYPRPLEAFAHAWVDVVTKQHAFAKRHADAVVSVNYENLVASPEPEARRLFEALGEPWDDGLLARALRPVDQPGFGDWKSLGLKRIVGDSVGRWKQLSRATISELGTIVNETLQACGYEAVKVDDSSSPDDVRRRYELRMQVQAMREHPPEA